MWKMHYKSVPLEVLEVAGIDIENSGELTEDQINTIMSLIEPNGATQQNELKHEHIDIPHSSYSNGMPSSSSDAGDRLTLYILDDGSLKLTDATLQKEYFFTPRDLALHNIDVDNLTDETLQRIIQMAMESNEVVTTKKRRMEDVGCVEFSPNFLPNTSVEPPTSSASKTVLVSEDHHVESQLSLIGTEVEIKRDVMAISSEDEMRLLHDESSGKRSDHESYSERARTLSSESVGEDTISKNINGRRCISQIPGTTIHCDTNSCLR
ncbi:hypothetical protein QQG55_18105 [Brugia pahangi]